MNELLKRYAVSSLTTFLTTFLGLIVLQIQAAGIVEFTSAFWLGIVVVAARAAVKAVVEALPKMGSADRRSYH